MGVLIRKQRGVLVFTGMAKLAVTGFIAALAASLIDTIWAVYIDSFVHNISVVGYISTALTLISFFCHFFFIPLIEKTKKSLIYFITLVSMAVIYLLFAINRNFYFFLLLAVVITVLMTLRITSFGLIIKDKSNQKKLSRNEGLMYSFWNTAWIIGPLIAGYLSEILGINLIFALSAIFLLFASLFFRVSGIKDSNIKKKVDADMRKNFIDFFRNKHRVKAYLLGGGVNLWWTLIYLFVPLYIIRNNLSTLWVGYFLFAIPVPLILLELSFAKLAERIGFKKIFKIGFLIPAVLVTLCFFINNIFVVLSLLILASVGLAMLEPTTEAYFFDIVNKKDESRFYGPYNTAIETNHFVGKLLASTVLIFFPFRFIFLLFGLFMFSLVILSFRIKEVIEKRRKKNN